MAASVLVLPLLVAGLARPAPAAADGLYPGDSAGTWTFDTVCETQAWSRSYRLWYIVNDAVDYVFDDPDPDLVPGQAVAVDLAPAIVGPGLRGHLTLTGATSVTGTIPATPPNPSDSMWQGVLSDAEIGLAWTFDQQFMAIGADVPLPDGWDQQYLGVLGFEATITTDGATMTTIILAQPITDCSVAPSSSPADEGKTPPPTDTTASVPDRHTGAWFAALLAVLAACPVALRASLRSRR